MTNTCSRCKGIIPSGEGLKESTKKRNKSYHKNCWCYNLQDKIKGLSFAIATAEIDIYIKNSWLKTI